MASKSMRSTGNTASIPLGWSLRKTRSSRISGMACAWTKLPSCRKTRTGLTSAGKGEDRAASTRNIPNMLVKPLRTISRHLPDKSPQ